MSEELFMREKLAIKYCEQHNVSDRNTINSVCAFSCGFDIAKNQLDMLINEIRKQDHEYLNTCADRAIENLNAIAGIEK